MHGEAPWFCWEILPAANMVCDPDVLLPLKLRFRCETKGEMGIREDHRRVLLVPSSVVFPTV